MNVFIHCRHMVDTEEITLVDIQCSREKVMKQREMLVSVTKRQKRRKEIS